MKFFKIILSLSILTCVDLYSSFYTIRSNRELNLKLQHFTYVLVCFCPLNSLDDMNIKSSMKMLAYDQELCHLNLGLLFVPVVHEQSDIVLHGYDYADKPQFVLFHNKKSIARRDFMHKSDQMKRFILTSLEAERLMLQDHEEHTVKKATKVFEPEKVEELEEGYFADNEHEKQLTAVEQRDTKMQAGYQPIDIVTKTQRYWWNRGYGNPYYGRNGLKYRNYFPKNIKQ